MQIYFKDNEFSFQLLRILGQIFYGGADIGECLSTSYRIKDGDIESWYNEWLKTADRVLSIAEECNSQDQKISACQAYLRATNYYQNGAAFFLDINGSNDPRIVETWDKGIECFKKAINLLSIPAEVIDIPYEGTTLPGYFFKASSINNKANPTLILTTGLDGSQEELYFFGVAAALQRGYNCITYEGPGQGVVIRKKKLPFRPDWETVVKFVVDYAFKRDKEIDTKKISIIGYSMGGYLAPRAAAFENRLAACIADDGILSSYKALAGKLNVIAEDIENGNERVVNAVLQALMSIDLGTRWKINHSLWVMGVKSPFELIQKSKEYSMENIASKIKCPTLLLAGERDYSFPGQAQKLYELLTCPKKLIQFTVEEGGEDHCHVAALSLANQRIFDWLDKTLDTKSNY